MTFPDEAAARKHAFAEGVTVHHGGKVINAAKRKVTPLVQAVMDAHPTLTPFGSEAEASPAETPTEAAIIPELRKMFDELKVQLKDKCEFTITVNRDLDTHLIKSLTVVKK